MVPNPDAQVRDRQTSYSNCKTASRASAQRRAPIQKQIGASRKLLGQDGGQQSVSQCHEGGKTRAATGVACGGLGCRGHGAVRERCGGGATTGKREWQAGLLVGARP